MSNSATNKEVRVRLRLTEFEKKKRKKEREEKKKREEESRRKSVESFNQLIGLGVLVYEDGGK
jgi:hypothetical protein